MGELGVEGLDGDPAAEELVATEPHRGHPAAGDAVVQPVATGEEAAGARAGSSRETLMGIDHVGCSVSEADPGVVSARPGS